MKEVEDLAYRVYVTDAFRQIGRLDGKRYIEAVVDLYKPKETRTSEEIIENIRNKLRNI